MNQKIIRTLFFDKDGPSDRFDDRRDGSGSRRREGRRDSDRRDHHDRRSSEETPSNEQDDSRYANEEVKEVEIYE